MFCWQFTLVVAGTLLATAPSAVAAPPESPFEIYGARYGRDAYTELVDNWGKGPPELKGTRNFRAVHPGVAYRGGQSRPDGNRMPLSQEALDNLARQRAAATADRANRAATETAARAAEAERATAEAAELQRRKTGPT